MSMIDGAGGERGEHKARGSKVRAMQAVHTAVCYLSLSLPVCTSSAHFYSPLLFLSRLFLCCSPSFGCFCQSRIQGSITLQYVIF